MSTETKEGQTLVSPPTMFTWDQLFEQIPKKDNMVWTAFVQKYRPVIEKELGTEVTEEAVSKALNDKVSTVEHPAHMFLHVYKCQHCPEIHRAESPCFLISAQTMSDATDPTSPGRMTLKNVILAFPVTSEGNAMGALFVLQRNIPELKLLQRENFEGFVFADPAMAEYVLEAAASQVH